MLLHLDQQIRILSDLSKRIIIDGGLTAPDTTSRVDTAETQASPFDMKTADLPFLSRPGVSAEIAAEPLVWATCFGRH